MNFWSDRCIVAPTNEAARRINTRIRQSLPFSSPTFYSTDTILNETDKVNEEFYPKEFLYTIETSGLPPHVLDLCPGCVVIVLRNYAPHLGVVNGTRAVVLVVHKRVLTLLILTGRQKGDVFELPRINCDNNDGELPFKFRRFQFPVKLAWAMTINKAQGQEFGGRIGVYLPSPVFCHGQLYVALSRATMERNVKILAEDNGEDHKIVKLQNGDYVLRTLNIVDRDILYDRSTSTKRPHCDPSAEEQDVNQTAIIASLPTPADPLERDAAAESLPILTDDDDPPPNWLPPALHDETSEPCNYVGDEDLICKASDSRNEGLTEENCEILDESPDEERFALHVESVTEAPAELRRRAKAGDSRVTLTD